MGNLPTVGPFATSDVDATSFLQGEWRALLRRDGIRNDTTGTALAVTATGANTSITVAAGTAVIQGHLASDTASESFDLGALGVQPTSGQTRIDLVVLRLNPSTKTVARTVLTGTPASSNAAAPAMTRNASGTWDVPLAKVTRVGPVAVQQYMITDLRPHAGDHLGPYPSAADLPSDSPIGSTATVRCDRYERLIFQDTIGVQWINTDAPPWYNASLSSGYASVYATAPVGYRFSDGRVWLRGEVRKTSGTFSGTSGTIITLPTDYRPLENFRAPASSGGGDSAPLTVEVTTSGVVRVYAAGTTGAASVYLSSVSFPIG